MCHSGILPLPSTGRVFFYWHLERSRLRALALLARVLVVLVLVLVVLVLVVFGGWCCRASLVKKKYWLGVFCFVRAGLVSLAVCGGCPPPRFGRPSCAPLALPFGRPCVSVRRAPGAAGGGWRVCARPFGCLLCPIFGRSLRSRPLFCCGSSLRSRPQPSFFGLRPSY